LTPERLSYGRWRLRVTGAVQGVGFRPFVHRLAVRHHLSGYVCNGPDGVIAEIEGAHCDEFLATLRREPPPLARIAAIETTRMPTTGDLGFAIRASLGAPSLGAPCLGAARAAADAATCAACLDELFDPASRFHHYPFITCTDCGPRFTITACLPYDRANTAMAAFPLCAACDHDYRHPASRRFHAESLACPVCGPRLSHPIAEIATAVRRGQIVALKGVGGFQLLCDATSDTAVARLRARKRRPHRPLAVMVATAAAILAFARPTPAEIALLESAARPIVLLRKARGLAASVAPGLDRIGVMLPSAPAHHLVFDALARMNWPSAASPVLIMTSANRAGAPLAIEAAEIASLADLVVSHDRTILQRADDSVMRIIDGAPAFIRRARGFVPEPIDLGEDGPPVLALGAHQKATVCVTRGREAFLSQHVGDLDSAPTVRFYQRTARSLLAALGVTPDLVACDQHPDYRSSAFAEATGLPLLRVQHHAAHLAAVAAEHRLRGPLIGVALDGAGYGAPGESPASQSWGGELMLRAGGAWRRIGHLCPLPLPGGDRAARDPWRMGVAALVALGRGADAAARFPRQISAGPLAAAAPAAPTTTSMGRLFDAAAALLGVCEEQTYEGQAAAELEALAAAPACLPAGFIIAGEALDFRPLLGALLRPGLTAQDGAALFHGTIVSGLVAWIGQAAARAGITDIALGGGCLINRVLADGLADALRARGLHPFLPLAAPANDGGLALGQAAIARAHLTTRAAQDQMSCA
jgi:hydrogenase maturation protein HypF